MTGDSASLAAFRRLLESTTALPEAERAVPLTDRLVGPVAAALLRRCAVPHEFDRALLQRLGALSDAEADARYAEFAELSLMQLGEDTLSLHERWRQPLWRWWLLDQQRGEFTTLSEMLVEWFSAAPASTTGDDLVARRRMFHLIGCRRSQGLSSFDALFRAARHRRRFSECSLLLRLAHEYDPVLHASELAQLAYQEGKLASDLRDWPRALTLLSGVADAQQAHARVRLNARVRAAHALRQSTRLDDALALLESARHQVLADAGLLRSNWRVLYELGEVYRDQGRAEEASATLEQALASATANANDDEDEADVAGILNSLGTVQLKLRETDRAIVSFQSSLAQLQRRGDAVRAGSVLNNLGLAQLEHCDWAAAEATLLSSLDSKRQSGDQPGQATAWLNISRVQAAQERLAEARASAEKAVLAFEAIGDARGRERARLALARLQRRDGQPSQAAALLQAVQAQALADGDTATAAAAQAELVHAERRGGLRWWAWLLVIFAVLLMLSLVVAVILADNES